MLIAWFKKDLKDFAKEEALSLCKSAELLDDSRILADCDAEKLIINSFIIDKISDCLAIFSDSKEAKIDAKKHLNPSESFKVKCPDIKVCIDLGQIIKDQTGAKVSLNEPDKTFIAEKIGEKYYCYIDIPGAQNLSKRGYLSSNTEFISADYCKALIDYSGYKDNGKLLDAFSHEGCVAIECCLKLLKVGPAYFNSKDFLFEMPEPKVKPLKNKILCYSDSMTDLKYCKQNAKLSKTFKFIDFGFSTLNDIDYTLKEGNIDYFASVLPKKADIEKLFFQLDYIMAKKSVVAIITYQDITGKFEEFGFKIEKQLKLESGSMIKLVRN